MRKCKGYFLTGPKPTKSMSFAFVAAIFASLVVSILAFAVPVLFPMLYDPAWLPFLIGVGVGSIGSSPFWKGRVGKKFSFPYRVRIFIHETKHAVVVALAGGKVEDFRVYGSREDGYQEDGNLKGEHLGGKVVHKLKKRDLKFKPFISLAPYFLPLFSFPALILCMVGWPFDRFRCAAMLGICLSLDTILAYLEFRRNQLDFNSLAGGRRLAAVFLFCFHMMWLLLCLLWIFGGNEALYEVVKAPVQIALRTESLLH